jgi:alpha-L-fucosidase
MEKTLFKKTLHDCIQAGPFNTSWDSLLKYRVPAWYEDAKFGIFIHWGVYSVPAHFSEKYPARMYQQGHEVHRYHRERYGPQSEFGYKDFIPMFRAEKFDPDEWAGLFRRAGAKFVVPVAEHHDGFAMYNSSFSEWNSVKMGPKRDIVGELAEAVRKQYMVFGLSSHRAEHWFYYHHGMTFDSDVRDPRLTGLYGPAQPRTMQANEVFLEDWLARCCELVDKYEPQLFWFDWTIEEPAFRPYTQKFATYYYNRGAQWERGVAMNYKKIHHPDAYPDGFAVLDIERGQLSDIRYPFWQTDTAIAKNSWGYTDSLDYKTAGSIVGDLIDIVSKNGALLLNICPRADGTIPEAEQAILQEIGDWLSVNGEAIYGTRPWKIFGEGPTEIVAGLYNDDKRQAFTDKDIRFTTRGNNLYAIVLDWPTKGEVNIRSLASGSGLYRQEIRKVAMLGSREKLQWSREEEGLRVRLPESRLGNHAFVLQIT